MPNDNLDAALKEVYALGKNDELHTLEIRHSSLTNRIFICQDTIPHELTLETGDVFIFEPVGFSFLTPASGQDGFQELTLSVDNVGHRISDFVDSVDGSESPVEIIYRPYLKSDPSEPKRNPPLLLYLIDLEINAFAVTGTASFTNIINAPFPNEYYTRERFRGLGS